MTEQELSKLKNIWHSYVVRSGKSRKDRTGTPIEFRLSFDEWLNLWIESGHLNDRGRGKGKYCISRINDLGHYEIGNVFIQSIADNNREAAKRNIGKKYSKEHRNAIAQSLVGKKHTDHRKNNISKSMMKRCTVDGITIFESKNDLIAALGQGKHGSRSPNFRFI